MSRMLTRVAVVVLAAALMVACHEAPAAMAHRAPAASKAADFAGLWVNPEFNNEIWLHATAERRHGHAPLGARVEPAGDTARDRAGRRHPEGGGRLPGHRIRLRWRTRLRRPADEQRRPPHDDDDARHGRRRSDPGDTSLRARLAGQVHRLRRAHEQEPRGAARQRRVGARRSTRSSAASGRGRANTATTRRRPRARSGPAAPVDRRWRRAARRGRASAMARSSCPAAAGASMCTGRCHTATGSAASRPTGRARRRPARTW